MSESSDYTGDEPEEEEAPREVATTFGTVGKGWSGRDEPEEDDSET